MKIVIIGLSITSSWGNGHATTYRSLVKALKRRNHEVHFLERDKVWYAKNRDMPTSPHAMVQIYNSVDELSGRFYTTIRDADLVIVGSYVPDGIEIGHLVNGIASGITAFYDIDTPITLANVKQDQCEYLTSELICKYDLYLSFTGGPTLKALERDFGAQLALPLYCSVDPEVYYPYKLERDYALGYLGTYSDDRQPTLEKLLIVTAGLLPDKTFVVAGPSYPTCIAWPENVDRIEHLEPGKHTKFYNRQQFTLNVTRREMIKVGFAPSVRLFEAAACGTLIISDWWPGIETFFHPGNELLIAHSTRDVIDLLNNLSDTRHREISEAARRRIMNCHTSEHRAYELEQAYDQALEIKK